MTEEFDQENWRDSPPSPTQHIDLLKLFAAGILVVILVLVAKHGYEIEEDRAAFELNLTTEILGIAVTVLIINWFGERRAERQRKERLAENEELAERRHKQQLLDDATSISEEIATNAIHQIRRKGWLEGHNGILYKANLIDARLQNSRLSGANLSQAVLMVANLENAELIRANLSNAVLVGANLKGAHLIMANLENADLTNADLEGANLSSANLKGANLSDSNLQNAQLVSAEPYIDENTQLPDGNYWTPQSDLGIFTNPKHPNAWKYKGHLKYYRLGAITAMAIHSRDDTE